jgi:tonB-dependent receptor, plug
MSAVYPNNQQVVNPNLTNEKIFSAEVGYGFRSSKFNANLNLYRTEWRDRSARIPNQTFVTATGNVRGYSEINGITQVHMGVEVDATYKPVKFLELQGMFSYGDYRYKGNATGADFDESNNPVVTTAGSTTLYLDQVKVGGSGNSSIPQLTASLGATIKPINDLSIYGTWRFVGNLYSAVNTNDYKTVARQEQGALRLPDYNLLDLGISYKLRLRERSQYFTFGANVYNVIDTYYISDASTSIHATAGSTTYKGVDTNNKVFFGAGRTWAASVAFNF